MDRCVCGFREVQTEKEELPDLRETVLHMETPPLEDLLWKFGLPRHSKKRDPKNFRDIIEQSTHSPIEQTQKGIPQSPHVLALDPEQY